MQASSSPTRSRWISESPPHRSDPAEKDDGRTQASTTPGSIDQSPGNRSYLEVPGVTTSGIHPSSGPDSVSPTSSHEPKVKRRPHTKSRTGCVTCKKRRVKCDETRPACRNCQHLRLSCQYLPTTPIPTNALQLPELQMMHHYTAVVAQSIADAGISTVEIWRRDVPELAFRYPFLLHAVLMISATHLTQSNAKKWENQVVIHRSESLRLLRNEVQDVNAENLDALVAASLLMILDAMANASMPTEMTLCSLPASTWLHHVRGAATILLAVGVLPPNSRFYSFLGIDMLDLANTQVSGQSGESALTCFDDDLRDLYPVSYASPFYPSLAYLDKIHSQRFMTDFIMRVFAFPALMDNPIVQLLTHGDASAQRIIRAYYRLVRNYVQEMHHSVWFLRGVAKVLPIDMDSQLGGLGFVTAALPVSQTVESILARFDASFSTANSEAEALFASMIDLESASEQDSRLDESWDKNTTLLSNFEFGPDDLPSNSIPLDDSMNGLLGSIQIKEENERFD